MQVPTESASTLECHMTVGVSAKRIETEVSKRLQQIARRIKIPGLHSGKVPMSVIRQRYGTSARQKAMGDLIQETSYETAVEQKLNPAGSLSVEPKSSEKGEDLEYIAIFETFPELTVSGLENIKVERLQAEVSDADVDNMFNALRKQSTRFGVVERIAQGDDQLNIDFVGKIGGEAFVGSSVKGILLVLGSGRVIADFEEGLVGAKAGEKRVLSPTFPEDYQSLGLASRAAGFTVIVNSIAEPKLPELNEEFFALFGVKKTGPDGFRAEVQKNVERGLRQAIRSKVKNQIMEGPLQANPIEVPKVLIGNRVNRLRMQAVQQFGGNTKPDQLPAELFEEQAECRVVLGLIVVEAVEQRELKVDEGHVREMIEEMASTHQRPEQVVVWYFKNEPQLNEVRSVVLGEQVVDTVLQRAVVAGKQVSCEEAVKLTEAPQTA